jgi:hypothetical protein
MAAGSTARKPVGNQVAYLRKVINYSDTADSTISRFKMGVIPANSQILLCTVGVITAFSSAGTRTMTVGSNGTTATNIFASPGATFVEATSNASSLIGGKLTFSTDTTIYAKLLSAGTAASAGKLQAVVTYVPPEETT